MTRWVHEHGPAVRGFLVAMLRDREFADELLQEVFVRAWESRSRYADVGRERAYLLRIADRLARTSRRRAARVKPLSDETAAGIESGEDWSPMERLAAAETERRLAAAMEAIPDPQRRTLLLRFYGDLSFAEIADQIGCPLNTVLSHCRRGLLSLRRLLIEESV